MPEYGASICGVLQVLAYSDPVSGDTQEKADGSWALEEASHQEPQQEESEQVHDIIIMPMKRSHL